MILIDEILISEEVVKKQFACNLSACKGACCVEGDFGAPLEDREIVLLGQMLNEIMPFLPVKSRERIREVGFHTLQEGGIGSETELMPDGSCVFMGRDALGITFCGIEKAYRAEEIDFKKPISCHLYPIRVVKNPQTGFEALNYDEWDICSAACTRGEKEEISVFEFAKEAIERAYGPDFYEQLAAAAEEIKRRS